MHCNVASHFQWGLGAGNMGVSTESVATPWKIFAWWTSTTWEPHVSSSYISGCPYSALLESLINPLQDKIEDWKKTANQLDKDHAKGTYTSQINHVSLKCISMQLNCNSSQNNRKHNFFVNFEWMNEELHQGSGRGEWRVPKFNDSFTRKWSHSHISGSV